MLTSGAVRALEGLATGIESDLLSAGAQKRFFTSQVIAQLHDGPSAAVDSDAYILGFERPLLDRLLLARCRDLGNVELRFSTKVVGLSTRRCGPPAVSLIRQSDSKAGTVEGDVVVDAMGRRTPIPSLLSRASRKPLPTVAPREHENTYATCTFRAKLGLERHPAIFVQPRSWADGLGGMCVPATPKDFIATLSGPAYMYGRPSTADFIRLLSDVGGPEVARLLESSTPLTRPIYHRDTSSVRWAVNSERPRCLISIGDSDMSLDPAHSNGLTLAILGARELGIALVEARSRGMDESWARADARLGRFRSLSWSIASPRQAPEIAACMSTLGWLATIDSEAANLYWRLLTMSTPVPPDLAAVVGRIGLSALASRSIRASRASRADAPHSPTVPSI